MLSVLRRSCGRHPPILSHNFAELVPVNSTRTSAPPPLRGSIDPPTPSAITGPDDSTSSTTGTQVLSPVRLGNRIPTREEHGLYAFFRKKQPEEGQTLEGEAKYETLGGSRAVERFQSGRSWKASELRLKSFEDLHTLWYILLRERNLLATQQEEVRRLGAMRLMLTFNTRITMCRKSMARIKYVMNERRLAYEGALKLAEEEKKSHITDLVLEHQLSEHRTEREKLIARQRVARLRAAKAKEAGLGVVEEGKLGNDIENTAETETVVEGTQKATSSDIEHDPNEAEGKPDATKPAVQSPKVTPSAKSKEEIASETATAGLFGKRRSRRR